MGIYTEQALEILRPAMEARMATDTEAADLGGLAATNAARNGTPERLAIAREAMQRAEGKTFRRAFAWLTPMSGDEPIAVNPRHVESVETSYTQGGERHTALTLRSGETILVRETSEETVEKLEAVA